MITLKDVYTSIFEKLEAANINDEVAKTNIRLFFDSIYLPFLIDQNLIDLNQNNVDTQLMRMNYTPSHRVYPARTPSASGVDQDEEILDSCRDEIITQCKIAIDRFKDSKREVEEHLFKAYKDFIKDKHVLSEFDEIIREITTELLSDELQTIKLKRDRQEQLWVESMRIMEELVMKY